MLNVYQKQGKMQHSRLSNLWYVIQHPLGPSRGVDSFANHQESVEKRLGEMNARVRTD